MKLRNPFRRKPKGLRFPNGIPRTEATFRTSDPFWYRSGNGTRKLYLDDGGVLTYVPGVPSDAANTELRDLNFNLLWRGRVDPDGES